MTTYKIKYVYNSEQKEEIISPIAGYSIETLVLNRLEVLTNVNARIYSVQKRIIPDGLDDQKIR